MVEDEYLSLELVAALWVHLRAHHHHPLPGEGSCHSGRSHLGHEHPHHHLGHKQLHHLLHPYHHSLLHYHRKQRHDSDQN